MENIVYNELIIRGFAVDVGIIEHTIRDKEKKQKQIQLEVDFVCNKGMNKYYIQSAFSIPILNLFNPSNKRSFGHAIFSLIKLAPVFPY